MVTALKRKISVIISILVLTLFLTSCGTQTTTPTQQSQPQVTQPTSESQVTQSDQEGQTVYEFKQSIESSTDTAQPETDKTVENNSSPSPTVEKQETTVYITRTGHKYHSAGCRYLARSQIPISLSDAKSRGYTPCSVCCPPY